MTFTTGLALYGLITAGTASGLALFQYVVMPFVEGITKLKEIINERSSRAK